MKPSSTASGATPWADAKCISRARPSRVERSVILASSAFQAGA